MKKPTLRASVCILILMSATQACSRIDPPKSKLVKQGLSQHPVDTVSTALELPKADAPGLTALDKIPEGTYYVAEFAESIQLLSDDPKAKNEAIFFHKALSAGSLKESGDPVEFNLSNFSTSDQAVDFPTASFAEKITANAEGVFLLDRIAYTMSRSAKNEPNAKINTLHAYDDLDLSSHVHFENGTLTLFSTRKITEAGKEIEVIHRVTYIKGATLASPNPESKMAGLAPASIEPGRAPRNFSCIQDYEAETGATGADIILYTLDITQKADLSYECNLSQGGGFAGTVTQLGKVACAVEKDIAGNDRVRDANGLLDLSINQERLVNHAPSGSNISHRAKGKLKTTSNHGSKVQDHQFYCLEKQNH